MIDNARGSLTGTGLMALAAACALLAGCGDSNSAASNAVEMRDMDVVDGTVSDDMTDLDAVRSNGVGAGESAGNSAAPNAAPAPQPSAADTEAVPAE